MRPYLEVLLDIPLYQTFVYRNSTESPALPGAQPYLAKGWKFTLEPVRLQDSLLRTMIQCQNLPVWMKKISEK